MFVYVCKFACMALRYLVFSAPRRIRSLARVTRAALTRLGCSTASRVSIRSSLVDQAIFFAAAAASVFGAERAENSSAREGHLSTRIRGRGRHRHCYRDRRHSRPRLRLQKSRRKPIPSSSRGTAAQAPWWATQGPEQRAADMGVQ